MPRRIASRRQWRHHLKAWRRRSRLTQDVVAEGLDMSAANLSRIENHKQQYTQDVLEALADLYGADPGSLLMRHPDDIYGRVEPSKPRRK